MKKLALDNSAKIYPLMAKKKAQNLFFYAVELKQDICPEKLFEAVRRVMPRFPGFTGRLKRGFFWHYLGDNSKKAPVFEKDNGDYLRPFTKKSTNGFNFKIKFSQRRLTVEFYHVITDGYGALQFAKSLLHTYLTLCGHSVEAENILTADTAPCAAELEDSFLANGKSIKIRNIKLKALTGGKAFKISAQRQINCSKQAAGRRKNPPAQKSFGAVTLPVAEMLKLSRAKGVTLTAYSAGLIMYSVYNAQCAAASGTGKQKRNAKRNLVVFCPINLRNIFPSETLRNFTLFSRITAEISKQNLGLDYFIQIAVNALKRDTEVELLEKKIATTVLGERFIPLRFSPLFFKKAVLKIASLFAGKKNKTLTFSNVGIADLPDSFNAYVEKISAGINVSKRVPLAVCALTTFGNITFTFSEFFPTGVKTFFTEFLKSEQATKPIN